MVVWLALAAAAQDKGDVAGDPNPEVITFDPRFVYDEVANPFADTLAPPDNGEPGVWDDLVAVVHAPIHFQDTDDDKPTADWLAPFDYDGNFVADDNWDHFWDFQKELKGAMYYSVVETCTHWYVTYTMFHPEDWDTSFEQEHENDSEGILEVIRKDGGYGKLEALITVYHYDFYSFTAADSTLTDGEEDIDGTLTFGEIDGFLHPLTSQQARGHGVKAFPFTGDFSGQKGEDGVIYFPGWTGELPENGSDPSVVYRLIDQFETLWPTELAEAAGGYTGDTFYQWGNLRGNDSGSCGDGVTLTCSENSAKMPWRWDDDDDGSIAQPGVMALDPVLLVDHYFDGLGDFSDVYVSNRYAEDLRDAGWSNANRPHGLDEDLDLDKLYDRLGATCK